MSRAGDCGDNAVVESWNDKLKQELVFRAVFRSKDEVAMPVVDYIERFYNTERMYFSLDYMTPSAAEAMYFARQEVAD